MMGLALAVLMVGVIGLQGEPSPPTSNPDLILPGRVLSDGTQGNPDDVVFKVNGLPVTRGEWAELVNFRRKLFMPKRTAKEDEQKPQRPIVDILVSSVHDVARLKAVIAHFADRAKELQPRLDEIKSKIAELEQRAGDDRKALLEGFGELCNQYSDDPTLRAFGRDGRVTNVVHGQTLYPFDLCVFERFQPGKISPPVATLYGYEIFLVEEVRKGASPLFDTGSTRRLLLQWDPTDHKVAKRGDALLSRAKVEIVDPAFKQIVPPGWLLGPGEKPFDFKLAVPASGADPASKAAKDKQGGEDKGGGQAGGKQQR
ncbi:MAG: peptidylprolyl isomerase [Planctomycetota bacterium]